MRSPDFMAHLSNGEYDPRYQLYRKFCEERDIPPSKYDTWLAMSQKISDVYFHNMPAKRAM